MKTARTTKKAKTKSPPAAARANARAVQGIAARVGLSVRGGNGRGKVLLFSGKDAPAAAAALADELRVGLHRADLGAVVGKSIRETEKNLARVFAAADRSAGVLVLDEADAVFGKRTEVKDAHDRHANIEVTYLVQRLESSGRLVVLVSKTVRAMSPALERRMQVFAFPPR